jgi:hypothetical protein
MDRFLGYNQIRMAEEDKERTIFIMPWGTFSYKMMLFGLRNVGTTYQKAMVTLYHNMMHRKVEVFVDDILAKSKKEEDHEKILRKLFERIHNFLLKLNPVMCSFGVRIGKLLGFVVSSQGIEVDLNKVRAIHETSTPETKKEVRIFLGRLN